MSKQLSRNYGSRSPRPCRVPGAAAACRRRWPPGAAGAPARGARPSRGATDCERANSASRALRIVSCSVTCSESCSVATRWSTMSASRSSSVKSVALEESTPLLKTRRGKGDSPECFKRARRTALRSTRPAGWSAQPSGPRTQTAAAPACARRPFDSARTYPQ